MCFGYLMLPGPQVGPSFVYFREDSHGLRHHEKTVGFVMLIPPTRSAWQVELQWAASQLGHRRPSNTGVYLKSSPFGVCTSAPVAF